MKLIAGPLILSTVLLKVINKMDYSFIKWKISKKSGFDTQISVHYRTLFSEKYFALVNTSAEKS